MNDLEKRIQMREEALSSPDLYSNVRVLSRHALEVEQSLQKGTEKANNLSHLVQPRKQGTLLYSWHFSRYSAPIHWLVHGHMTSNNETVSRQMPGAGNIAKTMTLNRKRFCTSIINKWLNPLVLLKITK